MTFLRVVCCCDRPSQLTVSCNEVAGLFIMDGIKVICRCKVCVDQPKGQREFHPTHWEQHCGAGTAKKWKASIKIEPGGAPEVPLGSYPMQIGKWFDMLGVEFRPARTTGKLTASVSAGTWAACGGRFGSCCCVFRCTGRSAVRGPGQLTCCALRLIR